MDGSTLDLGDAERVEVRRGGDDNGKSDEHRHRRAEIVSRRMRRISAAASSGIRDTGLRPARIRRPTSQLVSSVGIT
jgi:hypothetical protein